MSAHTPGPWMLATSNSWRRFVAQGMTFVCEPITQNDGQPDLHFRNGGADGPDARLIAAAPDLLAACVALTSTKQETGQGWNERIRQARAAIAKATESA